MSRLKCFVSGLVFAALSSLSSPAQGYESEHFPDGVDHYWIKSASPNIPRYLEMFEQIYDEAFSTNVALPFGRSAALLVGVSDYRNLPLLPSVTNDLAGIRDFMLLKAGFDDVFIVQNSDVSRDLIENYVYSVLPKIVGQHGRLLFYFTGHGADGLGDTGYMLFTDAKRGENWGQSVMPIKTVMDWSREVQIKHMLFLFDCCASGLAFSSKSGTDLSSALIFNTLCGNGSRTVLTAGTAQEDAYALATRSASGNGVFTSAFLRAFENNDTLIEKRGIITINEIFGALQHEITRFAAEHAQQAHPRIWTLDTAHHKGTFLFLDPKARKATLGEQATKLLKLPLKEKGTDPSKLLDVAGIILISSELMGDVYIDGTAMGRVRPGQTAMYLHQKEGVHKVELRGAKSIIQDVSVTKGGLSEMVIRSESDQVVESPLAASRKVKKGKLLIGYRNCSGELRIDGLKAGYVNEGKTLLVEDLPVGRHKYSIISESYILTEEFTIEEEKTTQLLDRPDPPTNLRLVH